MMAKPSSQVISRQLLTIITPAYNEAANLPLLFQGVRVALVDGGVDWEWIIIDDHSSDNTFSVIRQLASQDSRVRGCRLARNSGSHTAIVCGLEMARGDCAIVIAADLQDPPEVIPQLLEKWKEGTHVVWAVRANREGERASTLGFARLYYWIMRRIIGLKDLPPSGADFFLLDRRVISAFCQFREANVSILALLTWMGFRQESITYDKKARLHGKSGWNFAKKLKLAIDSVTSFSFLPVRLMSVTGFIVALIGFLYAGFIVYRALTNANPVQGWTSLMVIVLIMGGIQMLMMGILGEYLWRTLDETRRRPRYIIEDQINNEDSD